MAFFFFHDYGADIGDQILVGGSFAKHSAQIMIILAEKAGAELAVGSKPDAGAMAEERLGAGGDEADCAWSAVAEAGLSGGRAAVVGDMHERSTGVEAPGELRCGGDP